jgi:hypothetical protein
MSAKSATRAVRIAALAAALSLGACDRSGREGDLAEIDNQIIANETDPALTSALEDQILVDPALTQQSNVNAVRPPETPMQAQYPVTRNATVRGKSVQGAAQAGDAGMVNLCNAAFKYGNDWGSRLPQPFAVYPGARIVEAAGADAADCHARVVSFTTRAAPQQVLDWYRQRASGGGYSAEQQQRGADLVLAGSREGNEGAYFLIVTPLPKGSEVALIVNTGA